MRPVPLSLAPRVVFDLRDWYQSNFVAPRIPGPANTPSNPNLISPIVRAAGEGRFIAEPLRPADPNWPFSDPVQLVTQVSTDGFRGFHGRVRTADGVTLARTYRRINRKARCRLTIHIRGFQPHVIDDFEIPGLDDAPNRVAPINLFPGIDYSFRSGPLPPSLVEGAVRRSDGTALIDATVRRSFPPPQAVESPTQPQQIRIREDGRYLLALNAILDPNGTTQFPRVDIELNHSSWPAQQVHSIPLTATAADPLKFVPPQRATLPTTVVVGRVMRGGRPVPNAVVAVRSDDFDTLVGRVRTSAFGDWQFYGDARLPLTGSAGIELTATSNGQSVNATHMIDLGKRNVIEPILLPSS